MDFDPNNPTIKIDIIHHASIDEIRSAFAESLAALSTVAKITTDYRAALLCLTSIRNIRGILAGHAPMTEEEMKRYIMWLRKDIPNV